jgi:hypothetical protein
MSVVNDRKGPARWSGPLGRTRLGGYSDAGPGRLDLRTARGRHANLRQVACIIPTAVGKADSSGPPAAARRRRRGASHVRLPAPVRADAGSPRSIHAFGLWQISCSADRPREPVRGSLAGYRQYDPAQSAVVGSGDVRWRDAQGNRLPPAAHTIAEVQSQDIRDLEISPDKYTPPDQIRLWVREWPRNLKMDPAAMIGSPAGKK